MADFQLLGRNGAAVTEDAVNSKIYVEEGNKTIIDAVAATPLAATDVGKVISNNGAAGAASTRAVTLPSAVAGMHFPVYNQNANNLRIVAAAGDTIRIGAVVSKVAGYIESVGIGASLLLIAVNATEWVAFGATPDWDVETS